MQWAEAAAPASPVFLARVDCACQENRTLREQNFELQSKSRADQNALKRIQAEFADKDKQLRIVVDQHAELLRYGRAGCASWTYLALLPFVVAAVVLVMSFRCSSLFFLQ